MTGKRSGAVIEHLRTLFSVGVVGDLPDGHLLDRFVTERDEAAFSALIERHGPMVLRVCRQVLGDPHDAQDAAQAVFLVLAQRARTIRSGGSVASWLHGVALRTATKARVAAGRRRQHERRAGESRARAGFYLAVNDDLAWPEVHEELGRLPAKFREPIVLCHLEGLTRELAARQLGWRMGTVQSRLARGQERLRTQLLRRGIMFSGGVAGVAFGADRARAAMSSAWFDTTLNSAMRIATAQTAAAGAAVPLASITRKALSAMMTYKIKTSSILVLAFGIAAIGGATLARQRLAAAPDQAQQPAPQGLAPSTPPSWRLPTAPSNSIEDSLEVAMGANSGRATGPTWKPAAADADAQPAGASPSASGRILDLQGRPVVGARLWVLAVKRPQGDDLGRFFGRLSAAREFNDLWMAWHDLPDAPPGSPPPAGAPAENPSAPPKIEPPATSDREGRIRLEGIGPDRLVLALIEGPAIESKPAIIVTRPGPPTLVKGNGGLTVHGSTFEHIAAPSRPIEGVVRDGKTGLPLPSASIRSAATLNFTGLINYVRTTGDARGRYRLDGIAEGATDRVVAIPPSGQAYLPVTVLVEVGRGNGPAPLDLTLRKGVWIQGRVTDAASGQPLDADVEYHAFDDNPHLGPNPGYEMHGSRTELDGSFRLLGLPGRGFVAAKILDGRYVRGVGLAALLEGRNGRDLVHGFYPIFTNADAVSVVAGIDPAEDAETIACELKPSTGRKRTGTVRGPDGKPLTGFVAFGLKPGWDLNPQPSSTAEFAVTALAPFEQRRLVFRHAEQKLIGTLNVPGNATGALIATLGPWSSVTGRVVGEDGKPRAGIKITLHHDPFPEHALGGMARQPSSRFELDETGRFRIDALAPGVKYDVNVFDPSIGIVGYVERDLVVQPGEAKDLGDRKVVIFTR
jgi:RNA polymerase sigma factor (sigma-70 family)